MNAADQSLAVEQFLQQLTPENHKSIEQGLEQLEQEWLFDINEINLGQQNESPEDVM
jgi:hypothetical protein